MHIDFATVSLILSILAVILIIPLNILSNVLTPKLQNWWASTSQRRLAKRIDKLEQQIANPPSFLEPISRMVLFIPFYFMGTTLGLAILIVHGHEQRSPVFSWIPPIKLQEDIAAFVILLTGIVAALHQGSCMRYVNLYARRYRQIR